VLKHLLRATLGVLLLANLGAAAQETPQEPIASPTVQTVPGDPAAPAENGEGLAPGVEELRIPVGGCSALVRCPTGGFVRCVSWYANGCISQPNANPPYVACDGEVVSCPGLL